MLVFRYRAGLAYMPHSIQLIDPSVTLYTSNGSNALEFLLYVTDIAGQNVTAGQTLSRCPIDDMTSAKQDSPMYLACHEPESGFIAVIFHHYHHHCYYH